MEKRIELRIRSQQERLTIAEVRFGKVEDGLLQTAVNAQIMCNRIVWKLNEQKEDGR